MLINKLLGLMILFSFMTVSSVLYGQAAGGGGGAGAGATSKNNDKIRFVLDDEAVNTKELLGEDVAKALYTVMVDTFEEAGEWYAAMPNDQGIIVSRRQVGVPLPLKKEGAKEVKTPPRGKNPPKFRKADGTYSSKYYLSATDERKYVLGVRVDFQKRGNNWFAIYPYRPIRLDGLVKSFEVWVAGRQKNHKLYVIVEDVYGKDKLISLGKLNFLGWKRMFVNVPDQISQFDYKLTSKRGLIFKGFLIKCSPLESWGKYYIYFDNLSAEVSRFWEEYQDRRDPMDTW